MYLLTNPRRTELRKRLIWKGVTLNAIAALALIVGGRILATPIQTLLLLLTFYVPFAAVGIPLTVRKQIKRVSALRYELTLACIRGWSVGDDAAGQTIRWDQMRRFNVESSPRYAYAFLDAGENGRMRIDNADVFVSDSGEPDLAVAIASYLGNALAPVK